MKTHSQLLKFCQVIAILPAVPFVMFAGLGLLAAVVKLMTGNFQDILPPLLMMAAAVPPGALAMYSYRQFSQPKKHTRPVLIIIYIVMRSVQLFVAFWFAGFKIPDLRPFHLVLIFAFFILDFIFIGTMSFSAAAREYFSEKDPQHVA